MTPRLRLAEATTLRLEAHSPHMAGVAGRLVAFAALPSPVVSGLRPAETTIRRLDASPSDTAAGVAGRLVPASAPRRGAGTPGTAGAAGRLVAFAALPSPVASGALVPAVHHASGLGLAPAVGRWSDVSTGVGCLPLSVRPFRMAGFAGPPAGAPVPAGHGIPAGHAPVLAVSPSGGPAPVPAGHAPGFAGAPAGGPAPVPARHASGLADTTAVPPTPRPGLPEWPVRGPVRPGRPAAAVVGRAQRTYPTAGSAYAETLIRRTQHTDSLEEQ